MNRWMTFLAYALLGFGLYASSFHYGFILDDEFQILSNPQVQGLSQIFLNFTNSTMARVDGTESVGGVYYKPVMMIFYNLLWNGGGGSPVVFHVFQLIVHILNSFLVFVLFQKFFPSNKNLWAFFAGAFFLAHPINSEAVLMIADLQEPLYTFFGLSGLLLLAATDYYKWAGFFFLLSLLSKETGVLYLAVGCLYCFLFNKERIKFALGAVGVSLAVYLSLRLGVAGLQVFRGHNMQISRADLATRLLTLPKVLLHYFEVFFLIKKPSLTQDWVVNQMTLAKFWGPLLGSFVIFGGGVFWLIKWPRKDLFFFFLWLLLGMGLHSHLIPLDGTVSDRWFYFSIIGLMGLLFLFLDSIFVSNVKLKSVSLGIILVALSFQTFARVQVWETPLSLYQADLLQDSESFYLNNNVGLKLLEARQFAQAIPYFEKTIAASPRGSREWLVGWRNLGAAYLELQDYKKAEECFKISLMDPDVKSQRAMAIVLSRQGREQELKEFLQKALQKYPMDPVLLRLK